MGYLVFKVLVQDTFYENKRSILYHFNIGLQLGFRAENKNSMAAMVVLQEKHQFFRDAL
jgi:hypothetical protein